MVARRRLGLRRERGLTLVQVAAASGLSQPFLSQLELGRTRPSMRSLFRIAGALGTTQQALLALADAPGGTVPYDVGGGGGARLLLHSPGADDTEFVGVTGEFAEFFCHDRHELLYVVRGALERAGPPSSTPPPRGRPSPPGRGRCSSWPGVYEEPTADEPVSTEDVQRAFDGGGAAPRAQLPEPDDRVALLVGQVTIIGRRGEPRNRRWDSVRR